MSDQPLEVVEVAQPSCFELVAFDDRASQRWDAAPGALLGAGWPKEPGAVRRASDGQLEALHFAPGRWLLPAPSTELLAALADPSEAALVDVEGKWQRRSLRGRGAMRLLAAAADVEAMLAGRDCATLSLFDCPAIVARASGAIEVWVHSSYAAFLDERLTHALSRAARVCHSPPGGSPQGRGSTQ
jgi:sarcosine oxidase gamma subunit